MKRYKNLLSIPRTETSAKRTGPLGYVLFGFLVVATAYILVQYHATLMTESREKTKRIVEKTIGMVSYYHMKYEQGELSEPLARQYALDSIKSVSADKSDYFWVMDTTPNMVMHPMIPTMGGMDLNNYTGHNGELLFVEMLKIARNNNGGYIEYLWTKPFHDKKLYPKVSYIKDFKPWKWVIGSGFYVNDVHQHFLNTVAMICGGIFTLLIFALAVSLGYSESRNKN